jgi:hypothetical protein
MTIIFVTVGLLASAVMAVIFSGLFKRLLKTRQDLLIIGIVCGICLILGSLLLVSLGLFLVLFGVPSALLDGWVLPLMKFGFYGGMAIVGCCCLYLFMVRLPSVAINRRRQVRELTRLGWFLRKPKDVLDVNEFKHLLIIGITLWSSQESNAIKTLQKHFHRDAWSVQVSFVDDVSRLAGIQSFNPGVDAAWPTPILTEYQDGVLVQALYGEDALRWMKQA